MIITVKPGDTLYRIASSNNTSVEELTRVNGLDRPDDLAVGQHIFIPTNMPSTYTVQPGDTMYQIARRTGVSLESLISANPSVTNPNLIFPGQVINIPNSKRSIEVNGYAIANISSTTLDNVLPYLTYLSIFSYQVRTDGTLTRLYETSIISTSRNASVAPLMVVTNIGETGGFNSDLAHTTLTNENVRNRVINAIISTINDKNYYGVNIDFEYIYPEDRVAYINFLRQLKSALGDTFMSVAVAPKYRDNQVGLLYEAHDYAAIGSIADKVIIMTYEWGYAYGEPMAVAPLSEVEAVIKYAVTRIPSEKILMGMPNYAYDWKLPWSRGDVATTLSNRQALNLALDMGSNIQFDDRAQAPFFTYRMDGVEHIVWFEDALSISNRIRLVEKYNLAGLSYWTVNNYYPVNWAVLSNMYNVTKIL